MLIVFEIWQELYYNVQIDRGGENAAYKERRI